MSLSNLNEAYNHVKVSWRPIRSHLHELVQLPVDMQTCDNDGEHVLTL